LPRSTSATDAFFSSALYGELARQPRRTETRARAGHAHRRGLHLAGPGPALRFAEARPIRFDRAERPWYKAAFGANMQVRSGRTPFSPRGIGTTISRHTLMVAQSSA
jgi:hypothetical protein